MTAEIREGNLIYVDGEFAGVIGRDFGQYFALSARFNKTTASVPTAAEAFADFCQEIGANQDENPQAG